MKMAVGNLGTRLTGARKDFPPLFFQSRCLFCFVCFFYFTFDRLKEKESARSQSTTLRLSSLFLSLFLKGRYNRESFHEPKLTCTVCRPKQVDRVGSSRLPGT